jgi:succinate dehydrogenase/fumarate reductase-like Fe-S protein
VGTQVMTINTTARMATADYGNQKYQMSTCIGCGFTSHSTFQLYINCQLVLAVGSQAIQRFNFISTNFQPSTGFVVKTLYQLSTCIGCGFTSHSTFQLYINQLSTLNWFCNNFQPSTGFVTTFNLQLVLL